MRCGRKLSFDTVEQAERTAQIVAGIKGAHAAPVRLYECNQCGHLHWTKMTERAVGSLASTVAVVTIAAAPPAPEPKPPAGNDRPPASKKQNRHINELQQQLSRAKSDVAWFKDRLREAMTLLYDGDDAQTIAILNALVSMPRTLSPTTSPDETQRYIAKAIASKLDHLKRGATS